MAIKSNNSKLFETFESIKAEIRFLQQELDLKTKSQNGTIERIHEMAAMWAKSQVDFLNMKNNYEKQILKLKKQEFELEEKIRNLEKSQHNDRILNLDRIGNGNHENQKNFYDSSAVDRKISKILCRQEETLSYVKSLDQSLRIKKNHTNNILKYSSSKNVKDPYLLSSDSDIDLIITSSLDS